MKRFVLLNPPLTTRERSGALASATGRSIPYGIISLASVLRNIGYEVSIIDSANYEMSIEDTVKEILTLKSKYVGITTVTISIDKAAKVADLLKQANDEIKVLVGGAHLSSVPEETMKQFSSFDIGVIGEAEVTIEELMTTLETNGSLHGVDGIVFRNGEEIIRTKRRSVIENLDSLPIPAWDIIPGKLHFYRPSAPSYLRWPSTTLVTSRGCFGHCIFCNSRALYGKLRSFSADYVFEMIMYLVKNHNIKDIYFYDDNFVYDQERAEKLCKKILDEKIDLTWSCYSRVDQGNAELFRLMKKAGCWQISYGIESGSQRILDFIKKDVTLEQITKTLTDTKKAGLRTRGFFMIGHFTEDTQTIMETISFMQKIPLDDFHFTTFTPLPGTVAYKMADRYGAFDRTWSKMNLQYAAFIPKGLSAEKIEHYSKMAYKKFYFRPKIILPYLYILCKYPKNIKRLLNAFKALILRTLSNKHCQQNENVRKRIIWQKILRQWNCIKTLNFQSVFFNKIYTLNTFKPGIANFGIILKGKSIEKLPQIANEFSDCFIVNNFDPEIEAIGNYLLNKNVVHFASRQMTTPLQSENYKKLNIKEIQLTKSSVLNDRGYLYAISHYHSLGLRTVFLPKEIIRISKNLFGLVFKKKFGNTGLLAIYYVLTVIKPRNLWIVGLDFYQADYLVRRSYNTPIEAQREKMKQIKAVEVVQNWIKEFPNVNFNIATYFDGFEPQHNLNIL